MIFEVRISWPSLFLERQHTVCPEVADSGKQAAAGCLHMGLSQVALANQAFYCIRAYFVHLVYYILTKLPSISIVRCCANAFDF